MCPACNAKRLHAPEDWAQHPYARHGYVKGQGWTHPDLIPAQHGTGAANLAPGKSSGEVNVEAKAAPVGGKA